MFYELDLHVSRLSSLQSLQALNSDKLQMKAKLRRLEEDIAKREKQIEELLDPIKVLLQKDFFYYVLVNPFSEHCIFFRDLNLPAV